MSELKLTWVLSGRGWADCTVADHDAETAVTASYITAAPEALLAAVAGLLTGESETRAHFEAEPTEFRWIFYREGESVWIRLLQLADFDRHDSASTEIWTSWQTVDTVVRALISCFDDVAKPTARAAITASGAAPSPAPSSKLSEPTGSGGRPPIPADP